MGDLLPVGFGPLIQHHRDVRRSSKGMRLGLVTTCRRDDQQAIFRIHHLDKHFNAVTTMDDVRFPKPDPEIYLKTAARLHTKPQNCLVFEDSPSGVRAAKAAGRSR
jgi:mannitol-1-/sugar-/sorbitol-6-/2-deoxyglucose-6-phosphatase